MSEEEEKRKMEMEWKKANKNKEHALTPVKKIQEKKTNELPLCDCNPTADTRTRRQDRT